MQESERRERGLKMMKEVYAGDVVSPPITNFFLENMVDNLFGEVWAKGAMSVRDRRLILIGIIAEKCESTSFGIQIKAALKNGELTEEDIWDIVVMISQYSGYPNAAVMSGVAIKAMADLKEEK